MEIFQGELQLFKILYLISAELVSIKQAIKYFQMNFHESKDEVIQQKYLDFLQIVKQRTIITQN